MGANYREANRAESHNDFIHKIGIVDEKPRLQAAQKDRRAEAREKSTTGGVLSEYVDVRRLSATTDMSLFQQACRRVPRTDSHFHSHRQNS
jgi:hypothetical protein